VTLNPAHEAQLINYLKATNIEVGLLLNFGKRPEFKRFIYDNKRKNISDDQRKSTCPVKFRRTSVAYLTGVAE